MFKIFNSILENLFPNLDKCKHCKSLLIDGERVCKTAKNEDFEIEVINIPTKKCPTGCEGVYWADLDFGVEIMESTLEAYPNDYNCPKCKCRLNEKTIFCVNLLHLLKRN